jgi:hypothetical protein
VSSLTRPTAQLSKLDEARRSYGLGLFRYLRSGTPLGTDNPAVFLAARSSALANLHAAETWWLASKVKEQHLLAQQALANDDSEKAAKHLLKAKELEALRSYEQKATDKIAATHLSNLKKAMNTAKNFERLKLQTVPQVLYCAIEKQKQEAEQVKTAQRKSLWNKSQQLKREQFSTQNLCHAPPTGQQVKKYLSSSKSFIHERVMSGGCSI